MPPCARHMCNHSAFETCTVLLPAGLSAWLDLHQPSLHTACRSLGYTVLHAYSIVELNKSYSKLERLSHIEKTQSLPSRGVDPDLDCMPAQPRSMSVHCLSQMCPNRQPCNGIQLRHDAQNHLQVAITKICRCSMHLAALAGSTHSIAPHALQQCQCCCTRSS